MPRTCQKCGQSLPDVRLGSKLTPLKAMIFDIIKHAGNNGIEWGDLFEMVWKDQPTHRRKALKAHIWQINDLIEDSGWKIVGRQYYGCVYRLIDVRELPARPQVKSPQRSTPPGSQP